MEALLLESFSSFEEAWIECLGRRWLKKKEIREDVDRISRRWQSERGKLIGCLGDLARYWMATEVVEAGGDLNRMSGRSGLSILTWLA
jgi:hypothetical protein